VDESPSSGDDEEAAAEEEASEYHSKYSEEDSEDGVNDSPPSDLGEMLIEPELMEGEGVGVRMTPGAPLSLPWSPKILVPVVEAICGELAGGGNWLSCLDFEEVWRMCGVQDQNSAVEEILC
jgi:hypothetical protein